MRPIDVRSTTGIEELLTVSSAHGVIPRSSTTVTMFQAQDYSGYKLCWPGDLVINSLWAWATGLGISSHHGIISTAYGVYRPNDPSDLNPDFLHYLTRSTPFQWELQVRSKGIWTSRLQLTDEAFLDAPIPYPPPEEQAAIVRYLDHADELINRYISAKERLIALLEEQRQAVIHQTVTRGLDSSVLLKPSGVPWIGDIPDHWSVRRLRTLAHISTGGKDTINSVENGRYPFFVRSQTVEKINSWSFDGEAVLTAGDGVGVGRVFHYINGKFDYHQRVYKFSDFTDIDGKLFYHYFSSMLAFQTSQGTAKSTVDSLRLPMLQNFPVVVPLPAEQNRLVQELDRANANTQGSINRAYRQIDLMNEYRTRLIADVVTGQLDVRSADANDLDMLEAHS